jgi:hypothetical protein
MLDGFSQPQFVEGRSSIADLFPTNKRCGLYILHFSDGEIYAGQAVDVTRRYIQHRKVHNDIEKISFKRVLRKNINDEERSLIWTLELAGHRLRNITFTAIPKGESDFDFIMSAERQNQWLNDINFVDSDGDRVVNPDLRRKYSKKFQRFSEMTNSQEVASLINKYVKLGIPAFLRSELSFWSCSCLPGHSHSNITIFSRINIYWQEVFTAFESEGKLVFSFHLARSPIEKEFGKNFSPLLKKIPSMEATEHFYEPGGYDQINFVIQGIKSTETFLQQKEIVTAIRLFNMRLMKKGACVYSRYHCLDLADKLIL